MFLSKDKVWLELTLNPIFKIFGILRDIFSIELPNKKSIF
jgi:hypothetical protein